MSGRGDQRIGDALYPHFAQSNVSVTEIRTSNAEEGQPSIITDPDTLISVLESFGVRFIIVVTKPNGKNVEMSRYFCMNIKIK